MAFTNNFVKFPFKVTPDDYARHLLRSLRKGVNYGHWKHSFAAWGMTFLPYQIQRFITQLMMPSLAKVEKK